MNVPFGVTIVLSYVSMSKDLLNANAMKAFLMKSWAVEGDRLAKPPVSKATTTATLSFFILLF